MYGGTITTFTASVEANYADDLRYNIEATDEDIRADFIMPVSDERIAYERAKHAQTARFHTLAAITNAVYAVVTQAEDASYHTFMDPNDEGDSTLALLDLEGVNLTVSVTDLVATATLVLPA